MSGLTAFLIVAVLLASSLAGTYWCIRRAMVRGESDRDRFIREACTPGIDVWDDNVHRWITLPPGVKPGLGQYTDREVASLDELTLAWDEPAFDPATDPRWAAGRARLLNAIDNDQKGDQA